METLKPFDGRWASLQPARSLIHTAARLQRSYPRAEVVGTRLLASAVLLVFIRLTSFEHTGDAVRFVLAYLAVTVILTLILPPAAESKTLRMIVIAADLLAISFVVRLTGGLDSSWFLLYVFPLMSAARSFEVKSYLAIAASTASVYAWGASMFTSAETPLYTFGYRALAICVVAVGPALLVKRRNQFESHQRIFDEIYRQILTDTDSQAVMQSILRAATTFLCSDRTAIALIEGGTISQMFATASVLGTDIRDAEQVLHKHYKEVLDSGSPLWLVRARWLSPLSERRISADGAWPGLLIPITVGGQSLGVLGVFSRDAHGFTMGDLRQLLGLTPLIALLQKNATLAQQMAARAEENRARLAMLYELGGQLRTDQGLHELFDTAVKLVSARVGSEEAALFLSEVPAFGSNEPLLKKVASAGPDDATTRELMAIDVYPSRPSLTGRVFNTNKAIIDNAHPPEDNTQHYATKLPSLVVRHYMATPLMIGDEVLGVIRVLNKRARDYDPHVAPDIASEGFGSEDLELLTMIATQIALAIRNAKFIETYRHFQNLVYRSPDPIIVVDRRGKIQNFNAECERLFSMSEQEAVGRPVSDFYESLQHARMIGRTLWAARDHVIRAFSARVRNSSGAIIPIVLSANLLLDRNHKLIGSIGVFKDARQMLQAENERITAAKLTALGRLAQTTGHDIKHDIGAILSFVDVLQRGHTDSVTQDICSGILTAATEALNKLQNMLMTATPRTPTKQLVSLNALITTFVASVQYRATASEIVISCEYLDSNPLVLVDTEQMRQVMANLFDNSMDAITWARQERPSAGTIRLTIGVSSDHVGLSWCDDGCGMSDATTAAVFSPFFTTKTSGSGLGLFITKTIVENHGGQIDVIAATEADSTCFRLLLPLFREPAALDWTED
jgi:PAS domain S-box-containing protein